MNRTNIKRKTRRISNVHLVSFDFQFKYKQVDTKFCNSVYSLTLLTHFVAVMIANAL